VKLEAPVKNHVNSQGTVRKHVKSHLVRWDVRLVHVKDTVKVPVKNLKKISWTDDWRGLTYGPYVDGEHKVM
jgi:hypothetical protein